MILFKYLDDNCLYPYNICTMLKIVDIEWLFDEETDTSKEGSLLDINTAVQNEKKGKNRLSYN